MANPPSLHHWLAAQKTKHCELCGISLFLNFMQFGLMIAFHFGN